MKKVTLALLVLALSVSVPAMAAVNITMSHPATGANYNEVTIGYSCDAAEEVRAFALTISVTDGGFLVDSAESAVDPNVADYYIYPGSISFTVEDGNTVIDVPNYGTPIAEQDANGGVLEMASLYSVNDPDPNRWDPPAASGSLCSFRVISGNCGPDDQVSVSLALNAKRGGVVLEDPNITPTVNLPAPLTFDYCCWLCPGHASGDSNGSGNVNAFDLLAVKNAWLTASGTHPHGTAKGQYNCCADFNNSLNVNAFDLLIVKNNWLSSELGTCTNKYCP